MSKNKLDIILQKITNIEERLQAVEAEIKKSTSDINEKIIEKDSRIKSIYSHMSFSDKFYSIVYKPFNFLTNKNSELPKEVPKFNNNIEFTEN